MYLTMSPRIRRSPFYEATVRDGVTHFTVYNKMLMPISFGNLEAELHRLMNGVAKRSRFWPAGGDRCGDVGCGRGAPG